jgi:leucyl-tRNA synthetase
MASSDMQKGKKTWKRDELASDEERIQAEWDVDPMKCFSALTEIPGPGKGELYTFPYPYSNGELHLGHGFTSVFYDVMARYARLRGIPVAQSFSYHLTGMPIVAAAYRLEKEFESYDSGNTSGLTERTDDGKVTQYTAMLMMGISEEDIRNFVDPNYWADYFPEVSKTVVRRFGIASNNAKSFITTEKNPYYDAFARWHFQKLYEKKHLVFGKRHSLFSVQDNQPCLGHERSEGEDAAPAKFTLIKFRLLIQDYNDLDLNQTDAFMTSHSYIDKDSQVYLIGLTMRPETLSGLTNVWIDPKYEYRMYRFGFYGEDENDLSIEYWIMQEKNRLNLQYQYDGEHGEHGDNNPFDPSSSYFMDCGTVNGSTFVDTDVVLGDTTAPVWAMDFQTSDIYKDIRSPSKGVGQDGKVSKVKSNVLQNYLSINMSKGTGIVGSVPSDSPIDYLGYMYKMVYEYGNGMSNQVEWSDVSDAIKPIIRVNHADYTGERVARDLIESKLVFTNDEQRMPFVTDEGMANIKEFCYFTSIPVQSMIDPQYEGLNMVEVREAIDKEWSHFPFPLLYTYYEPDSKAVSRSGEDLIVALLDQWFIDYSDPTWKEESLAHVDTMELYDDVAEDRIRYAINWLQQWPCSRTCGLGTRIPLSIVQDVDPSITTYEECPLIDSLSDSTIYMCLYTVYDLMQEFNASEFTAEVFDYIFLLKHQGEKRFDKFSKLRDSFLAYYPVDLRVSAKDLINNHLAMCIMNHMAVWDSDFMTRYHESTGNTELKTLAPKAYRINGYITVAKKDKKARKKKKSGSDNASNASNAEKMSKSKGNFKTLKQAIGVYAADPLRFTFCSASIGTSDAYFDQDLATRTVEKLHKEREFIASYCTYVREQITNPIDDVTENDSDKISELVMNELKLIIARTLYAYARTDIRSVVQAAYHELLNLRDMFVKLVGYFDTLNQNNRKVMGYIFMTFTTLMYPVIPHFCETVYRNPDYQILISTIMESESDSMYTLDECYRIVCAMTPEDNSAEIKFMYDYINEVTSEISSKVASLKRRGREPSRITVLCLSAGTVLNADNQIVFEIMDEFGFGNSVHTEADTRELVGKINIRLEAQGIDKKQMKKRFGDVIREYRRVEKFYLNYGDIFNRLRTNLSTYEMIESLLRDFLKQTEVKQNITVIECGSDVSDKSPDKSSDETSNLKFCLPFVRYEYDQ